MIRFYHPYGVVLASIYASPATGTLLRIYHPGIFFPIRIDKPNRVSVATLNAISTTGAITDIYQRFPFFSFYTKHNFTEF
jgi:hypothetical protein